MPGLNIFAALLLGTLAAVVGAIAAVRVLLRSSRFIHLTRKQRAVVWGSASVLFLPSLFIALFGAIALTHVIPQPGPSVSLVLNLTVVFGLGLFGAAVTLAATFLVAVVVQAVGGGREGAA